MGYNRKRRNVKPQRFCIFCGNGKLSAEHIFPVWLNKLLPDKDNHYFVTKVPFSNRNFPVVYIAPTIKQKQGGIGNKRIRVVCKVCNETWMSLIEQAAQPIITSLALGHPHELTPEKQVILTSWITLKTMVAEFDDPNSATIRSEEHHRFYINKCRMPEWKIWIGYYANNFTIKRYKHMGATAIDKAVLQEYKTKILKPNTQSTMFIIGNLLIYVFSSYHTGALDFEFDGFSSTLMRKILFDDTQSLSWPLTTCLFDTNVEDIGNALLSQNISNLN